ncbi:MAG: SIS domain-containing protein [Candidatus Niyogibacteria bacterium]|nr:SIS domain-containing protein [Candidatus Niyogibacteria bacterium]
MSYQNDSDAYFKKFFADTERATELLKLAKPELEEIIEALFHAWFSRQQVFLIGNGGSASTATHFAADLMKTVVSNAGCKGIAAISLVDNIPLTSALVNDWGKGSLFVEQLRTLYAPGDILIAFSVHGGSGSDKDGAWSQNLLQAIQYVKDNDGLTIGFSGFDGGAMKTMCHHCVVVPVESTPLVESLHVLLTHLITFRLKELI